MCIRAANVGDFWIGIFRDCELPCMWTVPSTSAILRDRGWTVELAFPWDGLRDLADGRSLPPKNGDVWRIDCSRFEKIGRDREVLDPCVGWTWNRHGHYDSHIPEVFPYVTFSKTTVGQEGGKAI